MAKTMMLNAALATQSMDVIRYLEQRDRLRGKERLATGLAWFCFFIPPFQLLLPITMFFAWRRYRARVRFERPTAKA